MWRSKVLSDLSCNIQCWEHLQQPHAIGSIRRHCINSVIGLYTLESKQHLWHWDLWPTLLEAHNEGQLELSEFGPIGLCGFNQIRSKAFILGLGMNPSLIPCGVLGGTILVSNPWASLKKSRGAFPLDDEHLYRRFMKGYFSSLHFPLNKIGPCHFTCDKVGFAQSW